MNLARVGGLVVAVILVLIGALWTLQGLGMGSGGMSGKPIFILIGLVVVVLGVGLGVVVNRRTQDH